MAKRVNGRFAKSTDGVSDNGGSGQGSGDTGTGSDNASGGSGNGGSGDGSGIVQPTLDGAGNGNGDGNSDTGGDTRARRGRPPGSRTRAPKAEISVTTLAEVISFAHVGIATIFKNDAWSLDDGESRRLADAAAKVLKHHDTPAFSAYAMDWIGLLMVAGNVYGPRIAVTVARNSTPRQPPQPTAQQEPRQPKAEQGDGFVTISDPMGSGRTMRMPVAN